MYSIFSGLKIQDLFWGFFSLIITITLISQLNWQKEELHSSANLEGKIKYLEQKILRLEKLIAEKG